MELLGYDFSLRFLRISLLGGIVLLCIFSYISYFSSSSSSKPWSFIGGLNTITEHFQPFRENHTSVDLPLILLWTPYFSSKGDWMPRPGSLGCLVDCYVTSDKKYLEDSSAVIFHLRSTNIHDLPHWTRNSAQKWVLYNGEAPPHTPLKTIRALEGKIHWTATYRRDSDFYDPYGIVIATNETQNSADFSDLNVKKKTYLVCWVVSHCQTPSRRETYVDNLSQHVTVAIYGQCGTKSCPNSSSGDCYRHISKDCKFYLSFENSICKDYVTEKLFNVLATDMVPVVLGGDNYSLTLPTGSYINAMDFRNPKALGDFLLELDNNHEKFKAYHAWKTNYTVVGSGYLWTCDLCQRLHSDSYTSVNVHQNLESWWYNPPCFAWTEIIKGKRGGLKSK